jgi:hypothetical protein
MVAGMKAAVTTFIATILLLVPATAAECVWQAEDGQVLAVSDPATISITDRGETQFCSLRGAGTGVSVRVGSCGDLEWPYFTVPSVPGGLDDILIFQNTAWYRWCAD